MSPLAPIERAIAEIAARRPVVVVDDENRENEGDLVFAADAVTPELVAFTMTECRGLLCVPMMGPALDCLRLAPMVTPNTERHQTAFTVSVDARHGVTTGISAGDRAATIALLAQAADPAAPVRPEDLVRPGHVFPLRAEPDGVFRRRGHTEAAVDLARLAGRRPAGVICEIVQADGTMARLPELVAFAERHRLVVISIADLIAYRQRTESEVEQVAEARLPLAAGPFRALGYRTAEGSEHLALVHGDLDDGADVLVRLHSECLTGDVLGSLRCDCGEQLTTALTRVVEEGRGVVLYLRGQEGRGIGLTSKLRAYGLQDAGRDTVDANLDLGLPVDARTYGSAAQVLLHLGVRSVRLLTNNPAKSAALAEAGLPVTGRVALPIRPRPENVAYLRTKRDRMGHLLELAPEGATRDGTGVTVGSPA